MKTETMKDLINPKAIENLNMLTDLHDKIIRISYVMNHITEAISKFTNEKSFQIDVKCDHRTIMTLSDLDPLYKQIKAATDQYLTLLESIYYSELKSAINEFNETLS